MKYKELSQDEVTKLLNKYVNLQKANKRTEFQLREANREIERLKLTVQSLTKGK